MIEKTQEFIQKAKKVYGNLYDYSKVVYKNTDSKVEITCLKHNHIFYQSPYNHLKRHQGCLHCINEYKRELFSYNTEIFIHKAKEIHGNRYDYSKVNYVNGITKVCITCTEHGDFWVSPANHIHSKHNCYKCSLLTRGEKRRTDPEQYIKKAFKAHNGLYSYEKTKYVNQTTKIVVTCPIHGDFQTNPGDHLNSKSGCPKCNNSKGEIEIKRILNKYNILYAEQYKFNDCRNIFPLPFDFYLPLQNTCIEFDGQGHFKPVKRGNDPKPDINQHLLTVKRDGIKTNYCQQHGIELIRIPYWDYNNIENIIKSQLKIE